MTRRGRPLRPRDAKTGRLYRILDPVRRFGCPPKAFRTSRQENLTLVPASLLPFKDQWLALANALPAGDMLVVLPSIRQSSRQTCERVVALLRSEGRRVITFPSDYFGQL
jgi:hypothetical protein